MPIRHMDIKKVDGKWMVFRDDPERAFLRGSNLRWKLHPDPDDTKKPVSAHFQFTSKKLVQSLPQERALTRDLTACIKKPNEQLMLKLKDDADRRVNPRYYAVWIRDETLTNGGVYAVGESGNPPPEMLVGG